MRIRPVDSRNSPCGTKTIRRRLFGIMLATRSAESPARTYPRQALTKRTICFIVQRAGSPLPNRSA